MQRIVFIERDCIITLLATVIETPQNESFGFLLGKNSRRKIKRTIKPVIVLDMGYPLHTAERKPSHVVLGNVAAWNRVQNFLRRFQFGLSAVGEFHSHPESGTHLSDFDFKNIITSMYKTFERKERLPRREWLEMVVSISKTNIQDQRDREWYWAERGNHLFFRIWVQKVRYDITVAGYLIPSLFPLFRELKKNYANDHQIIRKSFEIGRRKIIEAKLYTREQ